MPPKATRASVDCRAPSKRSWKGAQHGGDVLVEPFGDLVGADAAGSAAGLGMSIFSTNSPGCAVLLAVVEEEVLERRGVARAIARRWQGRAQRDQRRRRVADRRAVGDVAADGAGVADLDRAEAPDHLAHVRIVRSRVTRRVGVAGAGADLEARARSPRPAPARRFGRGRPSCPARCGALVTQSPTSVAPASTVASGWAVSKLGRARRASPARRSAGRLHGQRHVVRRSASARSVSASRAAKAVLRGIRLVQPLAPPARSARSRCSGRGCRPARRRSRRRRRRLEVAAHGEERHHEAGRAEAALRAVAVDHGLLDRGGGVPSGAARCSTVSSWQPSRVGRNWMQALTALDLVAQHGPSRQDARGPLVQAPQSPGRSGSRAPSWSGRPRRCRSDLLGTWSRNGRRRDQQGHDALARNAGADVEDQLVAPGLEVGADVGPAGQQRRLAAAVGVGDASPRRAPVALFAVELDPDAGRRPPAQCPARGWLAGPFLRPRIESWRRLSHPIRSPVDSVAVYSDPRDVVKWPRPGHEGDRWRQMTTLSPGSDRLRTPPPDPKWPGDARLALQFVINYEEGGENCILHGDAGVEAFLSRDRRRPAPGPTSAT